MNAHDLPFASAPDVRRHVPLDGPWNCPSCGMPTPVTTGPCGLCAEDRARGAHMEDASPDLRIARSPSNAGRPRRADSVGARIVQLLRDGRPRRLAEVEQELGCAIQTVANSLGYLCRYGRVTRVAYGLYAIGDVP